MPWTVMAPLMGLKSRNRSSDTKYGLTLLMIS
jgi:hypothetical protein